MGTKQKPGKYDCYDKAEPHEPMFTSLARDPNAPSVVRAWAHKETLRAGRKTEQVEEAYRCAGAMERWRKKHRGVLADKAHELKVE